jgi:2'-5' RNA ligase
MRLFFALWPDAGASERLAELARGVATEFGGKPVAAARIHLTLAFLGEVDEQRMPAVTEAASSVHCAPFPVRLDVRGSFAGARVAWAGMSDAEPSALLHLQGALAAALESSGFVLEERAFAPHATLARRVARAVPRESIDAVGWEAREFTLVRTVAGRYERLRDFPVSRGGAR